MELKDFTRVDRASLEYLKILLQDLKDFEEMLESSNDEDTQRASFEKLMTLTLGSSQGWNRLVVVASEIGISFSTAKRYVLRSASPHPLLFKPVVEAVRKAIEEEYAEIEKVVTTDEQAAAERRAQADKEWQELVDQVLHVEPDTRYNSRASYRGKPIMDHDFDVSLEINFSYPCRGIYDFSDHFPHVCHVCANKEEAPTHGRVFLSGEDGNMLLPHIIYSQTDVYQLLQDLTRFDGLYFAKGEDSKEWFAGLQRFVETNPFFATLPETSMMQTEKYNLNEENLVWMFL